MSPYKKINNNFYLLFVSIIFSATTSPSIAEEVIPPAYPAHSPAG